MFRRIGRWILFQILDYSALLYCKLAEKQGWLDEFGGPLHWAIQNGKSGAAIKLIENGEDPNQLDSNKRSPLVLALEKNELHVFKALVENQADVNFESVETGPLLFYAINYFGDNTYARLLIKKGANVNCATSTNQTPLHAAAYHGDTNIAKILIHNGAKINAQNNDYETPLLLAATMGHIELVEMLLINGANVNIRDVDKYEPIHYAAKYGHVQCVKLLIEYGASLNTKSGDGYSPMEQVLGNETPNNFKSIIFLHTQ